MNNLKKLFFLAGMLSLSLGLFAQKAKEIVVTGTVSDEAKETLIGVSVSVKNQPGFGVITDVNGKYKIKVGENEILIFSYVGYKDTEVPVAGKTTIDVILKVSDYALEEVTVVASGVQRKVSTTAAITSVDVTALKNVPTANLSNALAGNVAGIIAMQTSGEPGNNYSEFWIRGISTFGANSKALVLVDGIERDFNQVNVEDIESFSILKDASATAIYGQRGANGVVIITTKRGKEGKVRIDAKAEYGVKSASRTPKYVDGLTYARLANEARLSRGQDPKYSDSELDIIQYELDPDLYPNIDWYDTMLRDQTTNFRTTLSLSGGGSLARYYISGAYYNEEGIYKTEQNKLYNANANFKRYNFRSNVELDITKSTVFELGVGGWIEDQNKPGYNPSTEDFWKSLSWMSSVTVPIIYSNGLYPTYGSGDYINPYVLINETGFRTTWKNKLETNAAIKQKLDFVTPGLNMYARFSYDATNYNEIVRRKLPRLYRAETQRDGHGDMVIRKITDGYPLEQESSANGDRRYYGEVNLNYDQIFNQKHRVTGLLLYYQQEYTLSSAGSNVILAIPKRNLALSGRATYSYDDRYLTEFNFGYTGTENFEKNKRFGFFPAISVGWLASNETFIKENAHWLNNLKFRASWGQVGNDKMPDATDIDGIRREKRFPYISLVSGADTPGYSFGEYGQTGVGGVQIVTLGTPNLTWEIATKINLGIDLELFNKFSLTADFFKDDRESIFMQREYVPYAVGLTPKQIPWANVGKMNNKGIDGNAGYSDKIGRVSFTLRGNLTYTKTNVLDYDEPDNALTYQMTKGYRWEQTRGLIALGLFKDEEEIKNSPVQTFMTDVLPGDIRYKDVNGDGKIDDDDVVPIGYTKKPGVIYGFGGSISWNGFDFNVLMQGSGNYDFFVGGKNSDQSNGVFPFVEGDVGNVLTAVANPNDRWISREISGTADTERADALFPRLTYGPNANNNRESTFWLRNGRYLRLKELTVGYTLPSKLTRKLMIEKMRIYAIGYNLAVWDNFGWWDPEIGSSNGAKYPIQKTVSLGLLSISNLIIKL